MRKHPSRGVNGMHVDTLGTHVHTQYITVNTDLHCQNVSVSDLIMTNEKPGASPNMVDGTKGHWVFQEGQDDLFLINMKNNKKYKFVLKEIE